MKPNLHARPSGSHVGTGTGHFKQEETLSRKPWNPIKEESEDDDEDDEDDDEEEYDSEESEQEDEKPPPIRPPPVHGNTFPPRKQKKRKYKRRRKLDRIQRTGIVDLNLTDNYGLKSKWGIREGARELIQNFADNVRTNEDGTVREVDWVFEAGENGRVPTYIAYAKGTKPRPNSTTGLHDKKKSLGYIFHRLDEGRLVLINHKTSLSRGVWSMGETTKGDNRHTIGGHGEGMKVGICALLRRGFEVNYYTNKEIWEWHFGRRYWKGDKSAQNKLLIRLHPHKPRKAKEEPFIIQDVLLARTAAAKTTTVIAQAPYKHFTLDFGDYLFLHPATGDILQTDLGTIILDINYRHKIFVKGIYIEERGRNNPPPLRYGIDFSQVALDRDRRSLMTHSEAGNNMAQMWNTVIEQDPSGDRTEKYLELLLEEENYLETLSAEGFISEESAGALLEKLHSLYQGKFLYSKEDKEISETIRIIRTCLAKEPKAISARLHRILLNYNLIKTAQARREEIFTKAPVSSPGGDTWTQHTLHAFQSAFLLHPLLNTCQYSFHDVPDTVNLNILRVKDQENLSFQLHRRLINFEAAHTERRCPLYQSTQRHTADEGAVCDCAVEELLDLILSEIDEISHAEKKRIKHCHKDLLITMPRHVRVEHCEKEGNEIVEVNWEALASEHFGMGFELFLMSEKDWETAKPTHRYHEAAVSAEGKDVMGISASNNSPYNYATPPSLTSQLSDSLYIWTGKTNNRTRLLKLPSSIPPSKNYVAIIRSVESSGALYSLPLPVDIPCPCPQVVTAERVDGDIIVKWTFPFQFMAEFQVTCSSIYDIVYRSALISGTLHEFHVDLNSIQGLNLDIEIIAISNGIESTRRRVDVVDHTPRISPDPSAMGVEGSEEVSASTSPVMTSESLYPDHPPLGFFLSEGDGRMDSDADGQGFLDALEDDDQYSTDEIVERQQEGNVVSSNNENSGQALREDKSQGHGDRQVRDIPTSNPAQAVPADTASDSIDHRPITLAEGGAYRVKLDDGTTKIIYIHHHNAETDILSVTTYLSQISLWYGILHVPDESEQIYMKYTDWAVAGEKEDADEIPCSRIIEVSHESIKIQRADENVPHDTSLENDITYTVDLGVKFEGQLHEIRSFHNAKDEVNTLPKDLEVLHRGDIAYYIGSGVPGWSVGFEKAGYEISVAVDGDRVFGETWNSNHEGKLYAESIQRFLEKYPQRLESHELKTPAILLLQTPSDDSTPEQHGVGCGYFCAVSDAIKAISPPMIFLSTSPKMLDPNHAKCLSSLYKTLLSNSYEFRFAIYDSTSFGTIHESRKAILFASRIGLRDLPDGLNIEGSLKDHLAAQGFSRDYDVHGDSLERKIRMIKDAFPPPMAAAMGRFVKEHVMDLIELTKGVDHSISGIKRRTKEPAEKRDPKRARLLRDP